MHFRDFVKAKDDACRDEADVNDLFLPSQPGTFSYEMERFVRMYEDAFSSRNVSEEARQDCDRFRNSSFHDASLRVWNHICAHLAKDPKTRGKVSIELLCRTLTRNRSLLEDLGNSKKKHENNKTESETIQDQYGTRLYKCQSVFCFYFHEGFPGKKIRKQHVDCHERPFQCEVEDCGISGIGHASHNALQRHMRTFHPDHCDLSGSFAQLRRKTSEAKWPCTLCSKSFTRNHNLVSHMLNHEGKKPFQCSECPKCFARKSDVKRDEDIHSRGK